MNEDIKALQKDNLEKDKENLLKSNALVEAQKELKKVKELNEILKKIVRHQLENEEELFRLILGNNREEEESEE